MKVKKRRKKDTVYKYNLRKTILILTMLICIIIAMITYWIYAYYHKYGKFYFEDKIISYRVSDYIEIKGDIVHLKDIDENINKDFIRKQEDIINSNNIVSTDITKGLYKNILSIMISYTVYNNSNNNEEVLVLNIDLKNDKLLSNDDILNMIDRSYKDIATDIFNEYIKLPDDYDKKVIDIITDKEITASEFNSDSEKYIIRIREKLPEVIKLYIQDNKVYYIVNLSEIDKVCYYTNKNRLVNIKREIGKI